MYEMADPANSFESYYALLGETAALLRNEKATRALQEKALLKQIEAFQKQAEENKQKEACEMQKQNQAIQKKEEAIREQTEAIQKQTEAFQKLSEAFQKQEESNRRQAEAIQQLEQAMQKQTKEIESLTSTAPAAASALPLIALEPNLATDIEDPRFIAGLPFKASYLKETAHALAAQVEVFSKDDKRLAVLSGTFIDREGRLVTCLHVADCEGVAEQVEYLMVTLPGGPEEKVRVERSAFLLEDPRLGFVVVVDVPAAAPRLCRGSFLSTRSPPPRRSQVLLTGTDDVNRILTTVPGLTASSRGEIWNSDPPRMFLKAVVSPAFVGGPVLDSDGFVIGVLSETDGIGRAGAVPVYRIEEAVSSTERT